MRWLFAATPSVALALAVAVTGAGCTAAFRTQDGGAMTKPGVAGGTTNSIYLGDRGGLFTQLGIGLLTAGAMGSAVRTLGSTSSTSRTYDNQGNAVDVTTTTTTYEVDTAKAAAIAKGGENMSNAAKQDRDRGARDLNQDYNGLTGGLEIAMRRLGGDTSGWMADFGWRGTTRLGAWGLRGAAKLGFGKYTFHDRAVSRGTATSIVMEDSTYAFFGFPLRLGVAYRGFVEAFAQVDLNIVTLANDTLDDDQASSPSPWRVGARATLYRYLYAELTYAFSSMRAADTSTILEVGLEF